MRPIQLLLACLAGVGLVAQSRAADRQSLHILYATGSRIAVEDPFTFNPGTIYQGLSAQGHTQGTQRNLHTTTDNRAIPATLPSLTVEAWPLHPRLTQQGLIARPDREAMAVRLNPALDEEGRRFLQVSRSYRANIQEPDIERPVFQRSERQVTPLMRPDIYRHSAGFNADSHGWGKHEKPRVEVPHTESPVYDYSGPPLLFTAPPEMLKNPLISNDPSLLKLFVKTNESGLRDAAAASKAAAPVRRMRSASYWDSVEAPNNPRAAYDTAADYEARARNTTASLFDLSDPSHPASPKQIQPSYNPAGRGLLRAPNTR